VNGEVETAVFFLACFGFFASLLERRFFVAMWILPARYSERGTSAVRTILGASCHPVRFVWQDGHWRTFSGSISTAATLR
jgi:hypothetical protein